VPVRKQESGELGSFKNMELFLGCGFMLLPGVADRSEFTSHYSCYYWAASCLFRSLFGKRCFCPLSLVLVTVDIGDSP